MKILLIEDEVVTSRGIDLTLRTEDIYADIAACGEDGIEFARHFDYDAVILDLDLPDIDRKSVV